MTNQQSVPLMSERRTALIGGALVAMGPVSMALYTPAMPTLVQAFATTPSVIKLTLTAYFAGFALAQLICGPLSDAYGRRPVTLAFLLIYFCASIAAYLAPTIEWMLAARAVQGVGAAVGVAIGRAIVRDQYVGQSSARIMNGMAMTLAVGPAFAPTIGGVLLVLFGWQSIFAFMVALSLPLALMARFAMAETNRAPNPAAIRPARLLRVYAALLKDVRFMRPALVLALTISLFYTMATILPFVLIGQVGLTPTGFGYAMMLQSGSFILGTLVTSRLLRIMDAARLVPVGFAVILAATVILAGSVVLFAPSLLTVMGPVGILAFGIALVLPHMSTKAIEPFPLVAGAASALMGFLQMGGGLVGSLLAAALGDPLLALASVVPAMPVLAAAAAYGLRGAARRAAAKEPM